MRKAFFIILFFFVRKKSDFIQFCEKNSLSFFLIFCQLKEMIFFNIFFLIIFCIFMDFWICCAFLGDVNTINSVAHQPRYTFFQIFKFSALQCRIWCLLFRGGRDCGDTCVGATSYSSGAGAAGPAAGEGDSGAGVGAGAGADAGAGAGGAEAGI